MVAKYRRTKITWFLWDGFIAKLQIGLRLKKKGDETIYFRKKCVSYKVFFFY